MRQRLPDLGRERAGKRLAAALLLLGLAAHDLPIARADTTTAKEYQIKAVYLFNLTTFVAWPEELFHKNSDAPFQLCILGNDPFGERIDIVARGEKVEGRTIAVHRVRSVAEARSCQIAFISQSETRQIPYIIDNLPKGVLTVSDSDAFIKQGGMVEFYTNRDRQVRLAVDPNTLQEGGLKASAKLLKISSIADK